MRPNHALLDELDSSLGELVPREPVRFRGEWSTPSRRTYASEAQVGTGSGPFLDVVDVRWRGALECAVAISGIAFLLTAENLYWVKVPGASLTLPVDIALHAYAEYTTDRATFTASAAGAQLPGVPVQGSADLQKACAIGSDVLTTGRVSCLARANTAAVFVLLIQRELLKVGRHHLWRLRPGLAATLPGVVRELLTRRRAGSVRLE